MTGIVHSTVATLPDEDGAEVNKAEWNADHAITGDVNFGGFSILNAVIAGSLITGLGTMSTQNANAVAITGGSATGLTSLSVAAGTLTTDVKPFSQTLTWNNAAVTFTAWDMVITDTASAAGSLALRIRGGASGTTELLALSKTGNVLLGTLTDAGYKLRVNGQGYFDGGLITGAGLTQTSSGLMTFGGNNARFVLNGILNASSTTRIEFQNQSTTKFYIGISSDTGPFTISTDGGTGGLNVSQGNLVGIGVTPTAVLHLKAGTATANTAPLKLTSGTLNTTAEAGAIEFLTDAYYATITTGAARKTFAFLESPTFTGTVTIPTLVSTAKIRLKGYTVATLPAGTQGDTAFVTDAAAPTFLATIAGGGAVVAPVFYDGTNWVGF